MEPSTDDPDPALDFLCGDVTFETNDQPSRPLAQTQNSHQRSVYTIW